MPWSGSTFVETERLEGLNVARLQEAGHARDHLVASGLLVKDSQYSSVRSVDEHRWRQQGKGSGRLRLDPMLRHRRHRPATGLVDWQHCHWTAVASWPLGRSHLPASLTHGLAAGSAVDTVAVVVKGRWAHHGEPAYEVEVGRKVEPPAASEAVALPFVGSALFRT